MVDPDKQELLGLFENGSTGTKDDILLRGKFLIMNSSYGVSYRLSQNAEMVRLGILPERYWVVRAKWTDIYHLRKRAKTALQFYLKATHIMNNYLGSYDLGGTARPQAVSFFPKERTISF